MNVTVLTPTAARAVSVDDPVTSLPIDVVFASTNGVAPLSAAQYKDYMTQMAAWWTTQARGLLGSDPTWTDTSYGAFQWTAFADVRAIQLSMPCATTVSTPFAEAAAAWGHGSDGVYTSTDTSHRRLLVIADASQCYSGNTGLEIVPGLTGAGSPASLGQRGFPGWGMVYAGVMAPGDPSGMAGSVAALIHEMGHTFGLLHAAGLNGSSEYCANGLDGKTYGGTGDTADCMKSTDSAAASVGNGYGDTTNVMGDSGAWQTTGLNGFQKSVLGIISDGNGLATDSSAGAQQYRLVQAGTLAGGSEDQAVRISDSAAVPLSEYWVDFPAVSGCTVRVLRADPTLGSDASAQWGQTLGPNLANYGGGVDTIKVAFPHPGSAEQCLGAGDVYSSWSGDVSVHVDSVSADGALVTINKTQSPSAFTAASISAVVSDGSAVMEGKTLSASTVSAPTADQWINYMWLRDGAPISGASSSSYTLTTGDVGHSISVQATAMKMGYVARTVTSSPVLIPLVCPDAVSVAITGSGIYTPLSANPAGSPTAPAAWTYQWLRNGVTIPDATASTYTPSSTDAAGPQISVTATTSQAGCSPVSGTSVPAAVFASVAANSIAPSQMNPYNVVGVTFTVQPASSPAADSWTYVWYRDGAAIDGLTGDTYTLTTADAGHEISWIATAHKAGYQDADAGDVGFAVQGFGAVLVGSVSVSGQPVMGGVLTASVSSVVPSSAALSYQWQRCDPAGGACTAIPGATDATYAPTSVDVGLTLVAQVTATADGYTPAEASSPATGAVEGISNVASVMVTGSATVGSILTGTVHGVTPLGATLSYQWYRCPAVFPAAGACGGTSTTETTYTVTSADVGYKLLLAVTVSATNYVTLIWDDLDNGITGVVQ